MDTDVHLKKHLEHYLSQGNRDKPNGYSHIQRICRIGYNQACDMVALGIRTGVLVKEGEYTHRIIAPQP